MYSGRRFIKQRFLFLLWRCKNTRICHFELRPRADNVFPNSSWKLFFPQHRDRTSKSVEVFSFNIAMTSLHVNRHFVANEHEKRRAHMSVTWLCYAATSCHEETTPYFWRVGSTRRCVAANMSHGRVFVLIARVEEFCWCKHGVCDFANQVLIFGTSIDYRGIWIVRTRTCTIVVQLLRTRNANVSLTLACINVQFMYLFVTHNCMGKKLL